MENIGNNINLENTLKDTKPTNVSAESPKINAEDITLKEHPDTIRFRELQSLKLPTGGFQNNLDRQEYQVLLDRMTPPFITDDEKNNLLKRQSNAGIEGNPPLNETEILKLQKIQREMQFNKDKENRS